MDTVAQASNQIHSEMLIGRDQRGAEVEFRKVCDMKAKDGVEEGHSLMSILVKHWHTLLTKTLVDWVRIHDVFAIGWRWGNQQEGKGVDGHQVGLPSRWNLHEAEKDECGR